VGQLGGKAADSFAAVLAGHRGAGTGFAWCRGATRFAGVSGRRGGFSSNSLDFCGSPGVRWQCCSAAKPVGRACTGGPCTRS